jgi:hypothetical protein
MQYNFSTSPVPGTVHSAASALCVGRGYGTSKAGGATLSQRYPNRVRGLAAAEAAGVRR